MPAFSDLSFRVDLSSGTIAGVPTMVRKLSDLAGSFADRRALDAALHKGDPTVYTVASVKPADGAGQLHYGLGTLMPGKIGDEYFLTKGHVHRRREAAEVYIGLKGRGLLLLENLETGAAAMLELSQQSVVYVPSATAHRTVNIGSEPLVYIGVYPADAGHDYETIAKGNFHHVIVERNGAPALIARNKYLEELNR
jgi:glucose-6-phosphate isomerase